MGELRARPEGACHPWGFNTIKTSAGTPLVGQCLPPLPTPPPPSHFPQTSRALAPAPTTSSTYRRLPQTPRAQTSAIKHRYAHRTAHAFHRSEGFAAAGTRQLSYLFTSPTFTACQPGAPYQLPTTYLPHGRTPTASRHPTRAQSTARHYLPSSTPAAPFNARTNAGGRISSQCVGRLHCCSNSLENIG